MHDEIIKHTKKVYREIKNPKHNITEKIQEIVIEIFIIVFAITLSIWLHNWSEARHEKTEANQFLSELKDDLNKDKKILESNKEATITLNENYKFLLQMGNKYLPDSLVGPKTDLRLLTTNFNNGRYEGFKSSGKIGTIENKKLKNAILSYYQQTIPYIISQANFVNNQQLKIGDSENSFFVKENISLYEIFNSRKINSMLYFTKFNIQQGTFYIEKSIQEINGILKDINKELKEE